MQIYSCDGTRVTLSVYDSSIRRVRRLRSFTVPIDDAPTSPSAKVALAANEKTLYVEMGERSISVFRRNSEQFECDETAEDCRLRVPGSLASSTERVRCEGVQHCRVADDFGWLTFVGVREFATAAERDEFLDRQRQEFQVARDRLRTERRAVARRLGIANE